MIGLAAIEWVLRVAMLFVVSRQQRHANAALSWIAFVFLSPLVATVAYFLFGNARLARRRIRNRMATELCAPCAQTQMAPFVVDGPALKDLPLTEMFSTSPMVKGNRVELMGEDGPFLDHLEADIDRAQHHVHLLFYIYGADDTGRRIGEAMKRAVRRGVACRVLVDGVGSRPMLRRLAPSMRAAGIEVRAALPVSFYRLFLARVDLRNHRKLAIIDGTVAYTGSRNLLDAGGSRLKPSVWRDAMMRLEGPITRHLQTVFVEDWQFEEGPELSLDGLHPPAEAVGNALAQAVPSGPIYETEAFSHLIVTAIHTARDQITLTSPYFIPDQPLLLALQIAALRGVHVRLICPRRSDQVVTTAAGRAYYTRLLDAGVEIFHHQDGVLHTKCLTVDSAFAVFGSGNLDQRSFHLNFELSLLLPGAEVTRQVLALQESYIFDSKRVDSETWAHRNPLRRIGEDLARLLSPVL